MEHKGETLWVRQVDILLGRIRSMRRLLQGRNQRIGSLGSVVIGILYHHRNFEAILGDTG